MSTQFRSFREFYPYYLSEHANPTCRRLHFIGSALVLVVLGLVLAGVLGPWWLLSLPVIGYGFAWAGHFFFEHNRPATFRNPWYSLAGDWVMFKDMLIGRVRF
ncbi:MAG: Mpo1-like protein [Lysobacteraceae bacterium]